MLILILLTLFSVDRPTAVAKLCGNHVVHDSYKEKAITMVTAQGCQKVEMVDLGDGYYLVYGVRVLRGE